MSAHELDCRMLLCPMPVIKTQDKIKQLNSGDELTVFCTDPGVKQDIPAWCRIHGHEVTAITECDGEILVKVAVG